MECGRVDALVDPRHLKAGGKTGDQDCYQEYHQHNKRDSHPDAFIAINVEHLGGDDSGPATAVTTFQIGHLLVLTHWAIPRESMIM
jgi:hypothetical protein